MHARKWLCRESKRHARCVAVSPGKWWLIYTPNLTTVTPTRDGVHMWCWWWRGTSLSLWSTFHRLRPHANRLLAPTAHQQTVSSFALPFLLHARDRLVVSLRRRHAPLDARLARLVALRYSRRRGALVYASSTEEERRRWSWARGLVERVSAVATVRRGERRLCRGGEALDLEEIGARVASGVVFDDARLSREREVQRLWRWLVWWPEHL